MSVVNTVENHYLVDFGLLGVLWQGETRIAIILIWAII